MSTSRNKRLIDCCLQTLAAAHKCESRVVNKVNGTLNAEKVALVQLTEGFGLTRMTGRVRTASGPGSPRGQPAWGGGCDRIVPLNSLTIIHEGIARVR